MTKTVKIGNRTIGGGNPILIQSMTNTKTENVEATAAQINQLTAAGCDIIRCAVPTMDAAKALKEIKKQVQIPVVADIHFDYRLAIAAMENGADKIRINPGNIGSTERVKAVVDVAKERNIPIRVGVNSGSLEKDLVEKYHGVTAEGLVESALDKVRMIEDYDYDQMVISIRQYLERLRQSMEIQRSLMEKELLLESHLKDAQLKYLQAQSNPHSLFNTLNAGAQLAMMEGADRTYDYIQNVADFFRYNVKKGNDIVTLREELELIDHYIYILNVRFSGDIHYEKEISDDLLDCAVPSMILQPIVENCVNHGIREMCGEGRIWLKVDHGEEDTLGISIRDNGIGMDAEIIEKLKNGTYHEKRQSSGSNGIAMGNVIARLKLFTQNEDVMTIRSDGRNQGTEVILYLPVKEREKADV